MLASALKIAAICVITARILFSRMNAFMERTRAERSGDLIVLVQLLALVSARALYARNLHELALLCVTCKRKRERGNEKLFVSLR